MSEQIDQFFNPDGTLISIPVKSAKKIAVLLHIARDLSPTTKYPEKELNAIIAKYHDDTAAIRRHMIEYGILVRDEESIVQEARRTEASNLMILESKLPTTTAHRRTRMNFLMEILTNRTELFSQPACHLDFDVIA